MKSITEYESVNAKDLDTTEYGWWFNEEEFMETVPIKKPLKTKLLEDVDESCNQEKVVGSNVFTTYKTFKTSDVEEIKNKSCSTKLHVFPF
tara:strand:- start:2707 stop:2979 length:273 start_codon:yes stop_codon:yes gene_type:complete